MVRQDRDTHRRRSIRLKGYDYSQPAAYFVTVCVQGREEMLGEIVVGENRLSDAGQMVQAAWEDLPLHYAGVEIGALVVMPNHIHGIIVLTDPVGATPRGRPETGQAQETGQARGPAPTEPATPRGRRESGQAE